MIFRRSSERNEKTPKRRRYEYETLEARQLLAGDFANSLVDETSVNRLLDGLDEVASWAGDLSQSDPLSGPLSMVIESDGTRLTIDEIADLGSSIQTVIATPLRTHLETLPSEQHDTDAIVAFLSDLPGVVSAQGGLTCFSVDEFRFDIEFQETFVVDNLGLDLGAESQAMDLAFDANLDAQLSANTTFNLSFGVLLDPNVSNEQAFFLRDTLIQLQADLQASAESVDMQLGYLEANAEIAEANLDLDLQVRLNDLVPDIDGSITLEELNGFDVSQVANVQFTSNTVAATITSNPTLDTWIAAGTPTLTVVGQANVPDVSISTNLDFAELTNFAHIDSQSISEGLNSMADAFDVLGDTRSFQVDLPFLDGSPVSFNIGEAFREAFSLTDDGNLSIEATSAAALSATLGIGIDYDPELDQVVLPFSIAANTQASLHDVNVDGSVGPIKNIEASANAEIAADGELNLEVRIDVADDRLPIAERMSIHDMTLDVGVEYETSDIDGSFQYGIVSVEFEGGSLTGAVDYTADFLDELSLEQFLILTTSSSFLLDTPIAPTATAEYQLGDLTVEGNLFSLDDVEITFGFDTLDWSPTFGYTGDSILDSLSNIDVDSIVTTLVDGITETLAVTDYVDAWNDLVGIVPTTVTEVPVLDPSILRTADDGVVLLLHEVPAAIETLPGLADLDVNVELVVDKAAATVEFRFNATQSTTETFDFGLSFGEGLGDAIGSVLFSGGEFAGGGGELEGDLSVQLDVDILLEATDDDVEAFLLDSSAVTADIYVNGDIQFDGSLGVLSADLDGSLIVAGDTSSPKIGNPATIHSGLQDLASGRYALDGSADFLVETSATGQLLAEYTFTVTPGGRPDAFSFEIDDLGDAIDSLTIIESPNFRGLMDNVNLGENLSAVPNALLDILQAIIDATNGDSGIFGEGFPVIGKLLAGDGNFLQDIYNKLALEFETIPKFDPVSLELFLENALANAFGIKNKDVFDIDLKNLDDIRLTLDLSGTAFELSQEFNTDLGFQALGASLNTNFEIVGSYDAVLPFGFSTDPDVGLYLDTNDELLSFDLAVILEGQDGVPDFEGWLGSGFIAVQVENVGDDTIFHGEYTIDLTEPSGDNKLTVEEALNGNGPFVDRDTSGLTAGTGPKPGEAIELEITVEAAEWAPALYATLAIDWQFDGFSANVSTPSVEYTDVGIDLGAFIGRNFCPIIESAADFLDPLDPVVRIFETEVPYISDVLDPGDILQLSEGLQFGLEQMPGEFFSRTAENFEAVNTFVKILKNIDELGDVCSTSNTARISLGSLSFDSLESNLQEIGTEWLQENLDIDPDEIISQLEEDATELLEASGDVNFQGGKIEFPIWENPLSAFEWILGIQHVPIVTMEVAQLSVDLELPLGFSLGPVSAGLKGSLLVEAGISVGYDTLGFSDYFESGDATDLFNGFYVSDTDDATGDGDDIPEVSITGGLSLFAKAGIDGLIEAEVDGGLYADVNFDMIDHDGDGRMRGHEFNDKRGCIRIDGGVEISASVEAKAFGIFEKDWPIGKPYDIAKFDRTYYCTNTDERLADLNPIDGTLTLLVGDLAPGRRSVFEFETNEDYTLTRDGDKLVITAFGASQTFNNAFPAGDNKAGLVTKIIANAGKGTDIIEFVGDIDVPAELDGGEGDDRIYSGSGPDTINGGPGNDIIEGAGGWDIITTGGGNDVVEGGPGNDTIVGSNAIDVFDGGSGDDVLTGVGGDDILLGGSGIDEIYGGGGNDQISGGPDKDYLFGGEDNDDIYGDGGEDEIDGEGGDDYLDGGPDGDIIFDDEGVTIAYGRGGGDTIDGGPLADQLFGGDDNDTIRGHGGEDEIEGEHGNDTLEGGDMTDTINGGPGEDIINGEQGNDFLYGGDGPDTIDGGSGEDEIEGGPDSDPSLSGGPGNDTIRGGTGDDIIFGEGGADTLEGEAGNDEIHGGPQNDYINGNGGNDDLFGDDGEDEIYGERGEDEIEGGAHDDHIEGGPDKDTIRGDGDNDLLLGGDGPDNIDGGSGNDEIKGGPGNDPNLSGGPGEDIIRGGSGDDQIFGDSGEDELRGDAGADTIDGGPDDDFIDGMSGGDDLFGRGGDDEIYGYAGNDLIEGGDDNDYIEGGDGHDEIWGDGGEDEINGDSGNDLIFGGSENDTIRGMSGNDEIYGNEHDDDIFADSGNDYVEGNEGNDEIEGGTGNDELHGNEDNDTMSGGPGNDKMYGEQANDTMFGNEDNDLMFGGPGRDEMAGDAGNDLMFGEAGPDQMSGGADNDTMRGGTDNDTMRGDEGDDLVLGNDGDDELFGDEDNDILRGNAGDDQIEGGPGNDRGIGGDGNDTLKGDAGNDILDGESGDDQLFGNEGRDELLGGPGVDLLEGGENADYLDAGDGIGNQLSGGPGDDVIVGSDDGSDDPNLLDTIYFGDVIFGDEGDDQISGLGGADIIDAGVGNDIVRGGTHGDLITGGPNATPDPDKDTLFGDQGDDFLRGGADTDRIAGGVGADNLNGGAAGNQLSQNGIAPSPTDELSDTSSPGHTITGNWKSIAGSASTDGLTQIGGFEEAIFADGERVYTAWVDTRNGNTEIYAAYHQEGMAEWVLLHGPGGVSDDSDQSRRPSIVVTDNQVLISWTSIDEDGNEVVKVATSGIPGPGPVTPTWSVISGYDGDHSKLAIYPHGALLARIDSTGAARTEQYWACPGTTPNSGWLAAGGGIGSPILSGAGPNTPRIEIDLATTGSAAGIATTYELDGETFLEAILAGPAISFPETCDNPTGPGTITIFVPRTGRWDPTPSIKADNLSSPAIAMGDLQEMITGPNDTPRTSHQVDVHVAWDFETDYENQVDGAVATKSFSFGEPTAEPFEWAQSTVTYKSATTSAGSDTISDTIGYAEGPSLSASHFGAFLTWMDDGVHQRRGDARSSIYVVSTGLGSSVYTENVAGDAGGQGISQNGGALQSLSISVDASEVDLEAGEELHRPYVGWTDAITGQQQVYLRHDLSKTSPGVLIAETGGNTRVSESGQTDTFTLSLTSQPTATVTITLQTDHQVDVTPQSLKFDTGNWSTPQTITVAGLDNRNIEGNRATQIEHSASSNDKAYDDLAIAPVTVGIKDNDLNDDGRLDAFDIDELFSQLARNGTNRKDNPFDVDGSGALNNADVDHLVRETFASFYGDTDLDGDVDFSDFLEVSANFGNKNTNWSKGDSTGDGETNFADFLRLSGNFGRRRQ